MGVRIRRWLLGTAALLAVAAGLAWFALWHRPLTLNAFVNKLTVQMLWTSPESLSGLGLLDDTWLDFHGHRLSAYTREEELAQQAWMQEAREALNRYGPEGLDGQERLTWWVAAQVLDDGLRWGRFERSGYRITQLDGVTVSLPQFLTDVHPIRSARGADRYLQRLAAYGQVLRTTHQRVEEDRQAGVVPPDFVLRRVVEQLQAFIEPPLDDQALVKHLRQRVAELDGVSDSQRQHWVRQARERVAEDIVPAYRALIGQHQALLAHSDGRPGIGRIPQGQAVYAAALAYHTGTSMGAEALHQLGLSEVARLKRDMLALMDTHGVGPATATLAERIDGLNRRPDQLFPNTEAGRQALIGHLQAIHQRVMAAAPKVFRTVPPHPLEIVPVPDYAQAGSPGGYYSGPALDGSRPGRFYINLLSTQDHPKWTLPTFMVHEGAPGHHFQAAAALMVPKVPLMRQLMGFTAYAEGWALYAERLARTDMGLYDDDPLGDLGRLQAEMFRATRLVVDTGLHAQGWSRERAIAYMVEHTGMPRDEVVREVERYAVSPGQATAYKVGQLAILALRTEAEQRLGARLDLRDFHDQLIMNGALPLPVLESTVRAWMTQQVAAPRP